MCVLSFSFYILLSFFAITLFLLPFHRLMISSVVSEFWSVCSRLLIVSILMFIAKSIQSAKSLFRTMASSGSLGGSIG